MRYREVEKCFSLAFERMSVVLFKPFSLRKWMAILVMAFFAGALAGGGGPPLTGPSSSSTSENSRPAHTRDKREMSIPRPESGSVEDVSQPGSTYRLPPKESPSKPLLPILIVAMLLAALAAIVLFFWWLSSRFSFVFYDAVVRNSSGIAEPWRLYKNPGNSYFRMNISLFALSSVFWLLVVCAGVLLFMAAGPVSLLATIPLALVLAILFAVAAHCIAQFLPPIMGVTGDRAWPALGRLWSLTAGKPKATLLYIVSATVVGMLVSVATGLAVLMAILALAILGAFLFLPPFFLLGAGSLLWVYCAVVGIPFLVASTLVVMLLYLPGAVFFRAFSLYCLGEMAPEYNLMVPRPQPPSA